MEETEYTIKTRGRLQLFLHLRLIPWLRNHKFILVIFLASATLILGYIGYAKTYAVLGEITTPFDNFYRAVSLFAIATGSNISPTVWELEAARFTGLATTSSAFILVLVHIFFQQYQLFTLRFARNHAIICGLGLIGPILATRFYDLGYDVTVIEKNENNEEIRLCQDHGATVLIGDATNPKILKKAQVDRARYLVSVLGDDRLNADVAAEANSLIEERNGGPLTCLIHIVDPSFCNLLRSRELEDSSRDKFRIEYFNVYQSAGESLIRKHPPFDLARKDPPRTHVLVIGVGRMGENVIVQIARNWYEVYGENNKKMRITLVDLAASSKIEVLELLYPALSRYCDLVPVSISVKSKEFLQGDFLNKSEGSDNISSVYICLSNESLGVSTALILNGHFKGKIPIIVRSDTDKGLSRLIEQSAFPKNSFMNIRTFPIVHQDASMEIIFNTMHEILAKAIHEEYLEKQINAGIEMGSTPALVPWTELSTEYKESNRSQADDIIEKLAMCEYTIAPLNTWDEPLAEFNEEIVEFLAKKEHERWMEQKKRQGWTYGSERDDKKKIHPFLVPWEELTEEVKDLDRNSVRVIPKILKRVNLKIEKLHPSL